MKVILAIVIAVAMGMVLEAKASEVNPVNITTSQDLTPKELVPSPKKMSKEKEPTFGHILATAAGAYIGGIYGYVKVAEATVYVLKAAEGSTPALYSYSIGGALTGFVVGAVAGGVTVYYVYKGVVYVIDNHEQIIESFKQKYNNAEQDVLEHYDSFKKGFKEGVEKQQQPPKTTTF